jgi:hypothetical protein
MIRCPLNKKERPAYIQQIMILVLAVKGISLLAIAGVKDKREESEIIGLHQSGALFFPVKIMKKEELFGDLKITEPDLIDTPVFFYLDKDFRVLDVFKPGYLKTEELYRWLSLILD